MVADDLEYAVASADIIYANRWHSMGTKDKDKRLKDFAPFQTRTR